MARPEKFEDLIEYQQRSIQIADIDVGEIVQYASPMFVGAAMNLIAIAEAEGYEVSREGEWKITRPKNKEERDRTLQSQQNSWDYDKRRYDEAMAGEKLDEFWARHTVKFAKAEGLPIPPSLVEEDEGDDA